MRWRLEESKEYEALELQVSSFSYTCQWYLNEDPSERTGEEEIQVPTWDDTSVRWHSEEAKLNEAALL